MKFRCVKKRHESRISLCIRIRFWMVSEGRHHSPKLKWKVFRHHSPKSKYFYVDMDEGLSTPSKLPFGWSFDIIQTAFLMHKLIRNLAVSGSTKFRHKLSSNCIICIFRITLCYCYLGRSFRTTRVAFIFCSFFSNVKLPSTNDQK